MNQNTNTADKYQNLGKRVFWLFFLRFSPAAMAFLLISIILFVFSFQPFLGGVQEYVLYGGLTIFLAFLVILIISLISAWLTYKNYVFLMAEDSFKIKRGVLDKIETAIPYRQIQNVDVERSFAFQMLGLSRLIILTAGHEDEKAAGDEAEGVIPAIEQKTAEWLQTELLKRADIQKTIQVNK